MSASIRKYCLSVVWYFQPGQKVVGGKSWLKASTNLIKNESGILLHITYSFMQPLQPLWGDRFYHAFFWRLLFPLSLSLSSLSLTSLSLSLSLFLLSFPFSLSLSSSFSPSLCLSLSPPLCVPPPPLSEQCHPLYLHLPCVSGMPASHFFFFTRLMTLQCALSTLEMQEMQDSCDPKVFKLR